LTLNIAIEASLQAGGRGGAHPALGTGTAGLGAALGLGQTLLAELFPRSSEVTWTLLLDRVDS